MEVQKVNMLDDKAPGSKLCPASRASSFYIENLLGTKDRGASARDEETRGFQVTVPGRVRCPGPEARRLTDTDVQDWSGTSDTARGGARSESVGGFIGLSDYLSECSGRCESWFSLISSISDYIRVVVKNLDNI